MRDLRAAPAILSATQRHVGKADKDESFGDTDMELAQAMRGTVEILRHEADRAKRSIVRVCPCMIGADEDAGIAFRLGADFGTPVGGRH